MHTSMGNFPPIHANCAAYAVITLIPLTCGSLTFTASRRRSSMTSRSCLNISGCWSYLLDMYCFIAPESAKLCVFRKGKKRILLIRVSFREQGKDAKHTKSLQQIQCNHAPRVKNFYCCQVEVKPCILASSLL